ncbi:uncharacterized protein LOC126887194 isoform X1 [Diabrotica virgifera virgifera]|uniref:DUF8206 domain-containing protein n=1 Tax=Diabrotica virgifera virgifera TaxID=50390 RepID=A0ABM5KK07_DIAVI|nr:uncharacterized protein LOC126887194 isoform X1 [Diabrotica virgifera virgifera]XP_050510541.1 uncharacterized protein LOC126887194 isoform X1 [Diabrotica virgifera virgifera]XP_050510542.1 uncharacterized protein LOC126887194 isoform X1 [Diabrotica virgifera virgifera]
MAGSNIEDKMKNLNFNSDINILLLGQSGVGKSTLINAFANYLTFTDLKEAKKNKPMVLIPSKFTIFDKEGDMHDITTGDPDQNEYIQTGESATQDVKTYVFPIWDGAIKIRLIDTPGMIDNRGIDQDDINAENILRYIANLHELHAICFLLKPNEARYTVFFQYCMNQIFSRLDKTACDNIIFCFTHTRGSDYGAGESIKILEKAINEIASRPPYAKISMKRNIFYFDNEPFKYLTAVQKGIRFDSNIKERNKESWDKSAQQSWRLIKYITGDSKNKPLRPHYVKSTTAINEARRMITQLSQPLAEITQLIHHNMSVLDRHKEVLRNANESLEEMKSKLYMPVIALESTSLSQPVTVCAERKCCEVYKVGGNNVFHYKQRCHDPCHLKQVPKEIIGAAELIHCAAMNGTSTCIKCMCDFKVHMHVYYLTKTVQKEEVDENIQRNITSKEDLIKSKQLVIRNIEVKHSELHNEHQVVVEACAKFAHFLQNNAITPFNDSYKEYIEYLVNRERSLGRDCNRETVSHLEQLLRQYVEIKKRFDEALKSNKAIGKDAVITAQDVHEAINKLYGLKHNGKKIKELYTCQKNSRTKEFKNTEYIHKMTSKPKEKNEDKKKKDQKQKSERDDKDSDKEKKNKNRDRSQTRKPNKDRNRNEIRNRSPPPNYNEATNRRPQNANQSYIPPLLPPGPFGPPPQGAYGAFPQPYGPPQGGYGYGPQGGNVGPSQWRSGNQSGSNNSAPEYDIKISVKNNDGPESGPRGANSPSYNQQWFPPQFPNQYGQHPPNWNQQPPANWNSPNWNQPPANWNQPPANWNQHNYHRGVNRQGPRNQQGRGREYHNRGRGGVQKNKTGPRGKNNDQRKSDNSKKSSKGKPSSSSNRSSSDSSKSDSD